MLKLVIFRVLNTIKLHSILIKIHDIGIDIETCEIFEASTGPHFIFLVIRNFRN